MANIENGETCRRITEIRFRLTDGAWLPGVCHSGLSRVDLSLLISTGEYALTELGDQLQVIWTEHYYRDDPHITMASTFDASGRLVRYERTNRFPWVFSVVYDEIGRVVQRRISGGIEHNFSQSRFEYPEGESDDHYVIIDNIFRHRGEWEHLEQH